MTKKLSLDEQIQVADEELEKIATTINELATRQQRLIGYRQCLVDMSPKLTKEEKNAVTKNTG
tara:strand:- start:618 stop:806 length:189 start_codon:yes stop_codon:yes gene_type:complete